LTSKSHVLPVARHRSRAGHDTPVRYAVDSRFGGVMLGVCATDHDIGASPWLAGSADTGTPGTPKEMNARTTSGSVAPSARVVSDALRLTALADTVLSTSVRLAGRDLEAVLD